MSKTVLVYVGTYTFGKSEGIYVYSLTPEDGLLEPLSVAKGVENPSFLAINPEHRCLYAVNEIHNYEGKPTGAVSAFSIERGTGELTFLNRKPSLGTSPCHVIVDKTGKFVLVSNYSSGTVAVLPIENDGTLGDATDFVRHKGSSVNKGRQEGPHAHSATLDSANRYAFVADLGIDKLMIYRFDSDCGKLTPNDDPWVKVKAGAGPRHFTFHPNSRYAYLINELDSTMTAFNYDPERGALKESQTVSVLPKDFTGRSTCADIHVSPSGRFVYGSNRGHDSIVIYAINKDTGKLTYVGHESTQGRTPRNFVVSTDGKLLLAANQDSDSIVPFQISQQTGQLKPSHMMTKVPAPVCLKIMRIN